MKATLLLTLLTTFTVSNLIQAQTGPAGVGSSANNLIWLDANELLLGSGSQVATFTDVSGNANHFTQATVSRRPLFVTSLINGLPAVQFDGLDDLLKSGAISSLVSNNITYFLVFKRADLKTQSLISCKYSDYSTEKWSTLSGSSNNRLYSRHFSPTYSIQQHTSYVDAGVPTFLSAHITPTTNTQFHQGVVTQNKSATYTMPGTHQYVSIGNLGYTHSQNHCLNGFIAEVIVFNTALNTLERNLIENYLGAKYNLAVPTDLYAFQASHNIAMVAVGNNGTNSQSIARGNGILELSAPDNMTSNEFLLAAHSGEDLDIFNTLDIPASLPDHQRWERTWRVDETGDVGNINVSFDLSGGLSFGTASSYRLLIDTDGTFTDATAVAGTFDSGTQTVTFNVNLQAGDYITLSAQFQSLNIHAINDGLWSNVNSWDCTCIPSSLDSVFIDPTFEITVDIDAEAQYLSIESSGSLVMNSAVNLDLYGDFIINGSTSFTDGQISWLGSSDQMIVSGIPSIEFNDMYLDNFGNTISFITSQYILNGTLTPVNGIMDVVSDPSNSFIINSTSATDGGRIGETLGDFTFNGTYIVRRFIPSGVADYRDISASVSNADLSMWDADIFMSGEGFPDGCAYGGSGGCFYSVKRFFTGAYHDITDPNLPLTLGHGYEIYMGDDTISLSAKTLSVSGGLTSGSITTPPISSGWNIQGNPFPSPVQWSLITKNSNVDDYYYVYDPSTGAYEWYDGASNTSSIPALTNGIIATGQGFWTFDFGSLTFNQSSKTATTATFVKSSEENDPALYLRLYENASTYASVMSIQENLGTEDGLDTIFDIRHLSTGKEKAPSIAAYAADELIRKNYIRDDLRNKSFELYTKILTPGYHTIEAQNIENFDSYLKVLLFDNQTAEFIDLKKEFAYTFYSDAFEGNRFTLVLTNEDMEESSTIQSLTINETAIDNESMTVTQMGHTFNINVTGSENEDSQIKLINVLGQTEVYSSQIRFVDGSNMISVPSDLKGVHILVITTGDRIVTKKVVF